MSDMRSQLLDASAELFADHGYEAVSMRDISRAMGFTQANLYYHFRDKADLIQATLAHIFELRALSLHAWLADRPGDQLEAFVRWFVDALMTDRIFARLLYRELLDGDDKRIAALSSTVLQLPFEAITAAVAPGRTDQEAKKVALSYVGFIVGQTLVLPLAPGLIGQTEPGETADAVATRLLQLLQMPVLEA
ncbi:MULTISPECIES: TetR/AcrR family transcriptional regulator [Sphingobium]|jgi:AcrR family transcriptional regulator|uniref:TetR/AcrR family transcriptional regulator n=2 Tax=Sphingobium TaxID=165695 RepID=A0A5B8CBE8_SPHSA|nr:MULTISPECIES: TetR/AcrR family transcriptional regulator [Sphingobium]QDC36559.1 TetR/AcrR family transcriptional regulator [Sphingobium fuliginis ATCC 27551]QNG43953.1 TetR/AcrR family transcriptional regulator [Sphingobium yanoikuyae]